MKNLKRTLLVLLVTQLSMITGTSQTSLPDADKDKNFNSLYSSLSSRVDREHIRKDVYYISKDPLPRRVLNYTIPGHTKSTLEEFDAWLIKELEASGYKPETDETKVQAFGRDLNKPIHHQYAKPPDGSPWYTARNVIIRKQGTKNPDELIIIVAHKDSQSWIASPGANDNGIGTCGALELARVLAAYKPEHTIEFIFCNEEHTPWTSITAARNIKASGEKVLAVINMDGIGVKPPEQKGHLTNVTRYTSPEGERLADMMADLNKTHAIGLEQSKYLSESPGDDDGSFINAGFPWAVLNIGSMPYGDPNYHLEGDTAEKVDYENAKLAVQLTLAAVLHLDFYGRP